MPLPSYAELFYGLTLDDEQRAYADAIFDKRITFVNAKSGSGKTTIAVGCAKILHEEAKRQGKGGKPLVYIFSPVEEKKMGYRPGSQSEKERDYITPLRDALIEIGEIPDRVIYNAENMQTQKDGSVWVYPMSHVFARGINLKGKTVIIAEAQNFTRGELKKVLTRIHDDCTVIVEGHDGQCDLPDPKKSGFLPYMEWFRGVDYAAVCTLSRNYRGELAQWADAFSW